MKSILRKLIDHYPNTFFKTPSKLIRQFYSESVEEKYTFLDRFAWWWSFGSRTSLQRQEINKWFSADGYRPSQENCVRLIAFWNFKCFPTCIWFTNIRSIFTCIANNEETVPESHIYCRRTHTRNHEKDWVQKSNAIYAHVPNIIFKFFSRLPDPKYASQDRNKL
jgi:hypothetical protein